MASATLESRETPPAREPEAPLESNPQVEITYTGNTGNDMGISAVGFRAAKYNPSEWHESNYAKYYQSFVDRDAAEKIRHESNRTAREVATRTAETQAGVTKKLEERCKDLQFWKTELERAIRDVADETDLLLAQKKRLEKALRATEIALHVVTDNLNCRQHRQGIDLVQDDVEIALLKELEIINNVRDLLRNTLAQTEKQIRLNRDVKQNLEMVWSDVKEALDIDVACAELRHHHTHKQLYPGVAMFQENQTTPESWAQFLHDVIARAEHERLASVQLRTLVDNVLEDTSRDMVEQFNAVDVSYQKRIAEVEDALAKLKDNLRKVCEAISEQEKNIDSLKASFGDLEDSLKKAQTRLRDRTFRPGVELCRDPAQYALVSEVNEICQSTDALKNQLNQAGNSLKDLQDNRMALEKAISLKKNSIFVCKDKCLAIRSRYPSVTKLLGYQ